jgi:hypothetical protein
MNGGFCKVNLLALPDNAASGSGCAGGNSMTAVSEDS